MGLTFLSFRVKVQLHRHEGAVSLHSLLRGLEAASCDDEFPGLIRAGDTGLMLGSLVRLP
jgi:hypothetical protein